MRFAPGRTLFVPPAGIELEPFMSMPAVLIAPFAAFDRPDRLDPTRLADHARQCVLARGRWHRLHCVAEATDAFMAPRFVTTLALLVLVFVLVPALASAF